MVRSPLLNCLWLELISHGTIFFSHSKTESASLSATKTMSRIARCNWILVKADKKYFSIYNRSWDYFPTRPVQSLLETLHNRFFTYSLYILLPHHNSLHKNTTWKKICRDPVRCQATSCALDTSRPYKWHSRGGWCLQPLLQMGVICRGSWWLSRPYSWIFRGNSITSRPYKCV